ncbi:hypothetical protein [Actinoplanes sp. G11-F43]|uniref:hypothetical protein n=1 Tax=Actinoplanes sp. G11-F43 TaxID=3424130 RepID=UPI003D32747C
MSWLRLYLRSRHVPLAVAAALGVTALMWSLWAAGSTERDVGFQMVVLTVLFLVAALTATLGGPDEALERTASFAWAPRRSAHLLIAFAVVVLPLLATLATGARFGPAGMVVRDAAGLLGLTALGAVTVGVSRSWFLPLGWTLIAVIFPVGESVAGRILTWQAQDPADVAAMVTAGVLAAGGLVAYTVAGPAMRSPATAGQG